MKSFDVAIAGGGLIGASIAFELAQAGLKVGVFDRGEPGREASWASAGILSPAPESPAMISMVPLAKASMDLYPALVAKVEEISGEKIGFRPKGTIDVFFSKDAISDLSTLIALHHGMGLKAEPLRPEDARELEPSLSLELEAAALRHDEASIDNRAFTHAMLTAGKKSGVEVFAGAAVTGIAKDGGRCTGLKLENETVSAKWTVIAAGCFSAKIEGVKEFAPVRPAKGQMVSLRADGLKIERVIWGEKIYIVPRNDGRILVGATVEYVGFDKQITAGGIGKILSAAIEVVPDLANAIIEETWAGLRPDSPDHLPILGPTDVEGLLIATGHFRSGILLTPITARVVRQWITERSVGIDWERLSPMRFAASHRGTTA